MANRNSNNHEPAWLKRFVEQAERDRKENREILKDIRGAIVDIRGSIVDIRDTNAQIARLHQGILEQLADQSMHIHAILRRQDEVSLKLDKLDGIQKTLFAIHRTLRAQGNGRNGNGRARR